MSEIISVLKIFHIRQINIPKLHKILSEAQKSDESLSLSSFSKAAERDGSMELR